MSFRYTQAQLDYLRTGYPRWSIQALTEQFNARFGLDKTPGQLKSCCKNKGFTCGRSTGQLKKGRFELVTQVQADFLRRSYPSLPLPALVAAFNAQFDTTLKSSQIRSFLKNHGITCGRSGHFGTDGKESWNKGSGGTGLCKPNCGSFQKGAAPVNRLPLWTERLTREGYIDIKVPETNPYTGQPTRFKPKHLWVWEQNHGPIPKGFVVKLLDGDKTNCAPDNLALISRSELNALNRLGFDAAPAELKPSLRQLAKLDTATRSAQLTAPGQPMRQQVLNSLRERPQTYREIAAHTGIHYHTVSALLSELKRTGRVLAGSKTKTPSGHPTTLWSAA